MQVLNMERDLEALSTEENEAISKYSNRVSLILNRIRLLCGDFPDTELWGRFYCHFVKNLGLRFYLLKSPRILTIFQLQS